MSQILLPAEFHLKATPSIWHHITAKQQMKAGHWKSQFQYREAGVCWSPVDLVALQTRYSCHTAAWMAFSVKQHWNS